jgi:hypothetical protein
MKLRTIVILMAGISIASTIIDVTAQGYPSGSGGRRGGGQRGEANKPGETRREPGAGVVDPFAALERELPSLKVDLLMREEQLEDWRVFERDVRDMAELERTRRRHLMSLRDGGDKPPTALTVIASLTEDARLRAEAAGDLQRHAESLYGRFDDTQRRIFDRRTVQSQTDPLGR